MVRIRIGAGWRHDPELRGALRRAPSEAARALAVRRIVDVVAIEVDGVDIAAGRAEGPLLPAAESLLRALGRLVAGGAQASVPFQDGTVELVLRRRGGSALLSLVVLGRPSRLLARDVEVDLDALALAAREAASTLAEQLAGVAGPTDVARRLLAAAARLARAPAPAHGPVVLSTPRAHRPHRRRGAPSCAFELRDEEGLLAAYRGPGPDLGTLLAPGRVVLRTASGAEVFSVAGVPFLLLRDLTAAAARIAAAVLTGERTFAFSLAPAGRRDAVPVELDLARGTVGAGGRAPGIAPPLGVAQAFLEAALDFCAVVLARSPRQAENPHLAELRASAAEWLAHLREAAAGDVVGRERPGVRPRLPPAPPRARLGPGRMKRLRFRAAWSAEVGAPAGPGMARWDDLLVACGREATLAVEAATGERRWRAPGGEGFASLGEAVLVSAGARLTCVDARTGAERWSRPLPGTERGPLSAWRLPGGLAALALGPSLGACDLADGRLAWRFEPPAAGSLLAVPFGAVAVVAADTGLVYGLDAAGGLAWRLRTPGALAAPPAPWSRDCLLVCRTERGASLLALDPATGRRRWEAPLDFSPTGPPVPFAGLVAVAGHVAGDAVVAAVDGGGAPAFTLAPSLGPGPLALAALRRGLIAKAASGACTAFDRTGAARWAHAREAAHPPPGNLPPLVARGVALVSSEAVEALDQDTGHRLDAVSGLAPVRLLAGEDLTLHAIDAEGVVTCARLETHLSVVD